MSLAAPSRRILTLVAPVFLALTTLVFAGADPARVEAFEARLADIRARLDLSEEQRQAVEPILQRGFERRRALVEGFRGNGRPTMREMRRLREGAERIRDETRAELKPILTPAQLAEYDRIQEELRADIRDRMRERRRSR